MRSNLFTEETARAAIETRLTELDDSPFDVEPKRLTYRTIPELAQLFYEIGYCPRVPSRASVINLLSGKMFPHLTDKHGHRINWDNMPAAPKGLRAGSTRRKSLAQEVHDLKAEVATLRERLNSLIYSR